MVVVIGMWKRHDRDKLDDKFNVEKKKKEGKWKRRRRKKER